MSLRGIIGAIGLAVALPFLAYLVYLSQAKTTSSDQVIFLAFAFSITFPTLILLSLVLFRSLVILAVSLPIYAACVIAGYARTFMAFQILGGLALFRHRYTARSYVITGWLVLTLPILIINPSLVAVILVPLFILLALGVETLLHEWYKLFPKNPYARSFGLVLTVGLIGVMVFSGIDRFVNGYRHMPEAAGNSSVDLILLKQHLTKHPAKVQIIASEAELPLYQVYARFGEREVVATSDPTERASTNILVSRAAREQLDTTGLSLTAIVTNNRSADGDRFYLYKVK